MGVTGKRDVLGWTRASVGRDERGYRCEFLDLVSKARDVYFFRASNLNPGSRFHGTKISFMK